MDYRLLEGRVSTLHTLALSWWLRLSTHYHQHTGGTQKVPVDEWTKDNGKVLSVHRQGKQSPWPPPPRPSRKLTTSSWSVYSGFPLRAHLSTQVGTWRPQRNPSLQILFGRQRSTVFQMSKMSEWTNCWLLGVHGRWDVLRTRRIFSVTKGGDWSPIPGITPSYSQRSEFLSQRSDAARLCLLRLQPWRAPLSHCEKKHPNPTLRFWFNVIFQQWSRGGWQLVLSREGHFPTHWNGSACFLFFGLRVSCLNVWESGHKVLAEFWLIEACD